MLITIPRTLEADIMNFVRINNIEDINNFLAICLRDGFNIAKYGVSPQDNFEKENKPLIIDKYEAGEDDTSTVETEKPKKRGRPRKQEVKEESSIQEQKEIVKPKKVIRIIKK